MDFQEENLLFYDPNMDRFFVNIHFQNMIVITDNRFRPPVEIIRFILFSVIFIISFLRRNYIFLHLHSDHEEEERSIINRLNELTCK